MFRYFVGFFAVIGFFLFCIFLLAGGFIYKGMKKPQPSLPENIVLTLKIDPILTEITHQNPLRDLIVGKPKNFRVAINSLYEAAKDDRVKGIAIQYIGTSLGTSEIQELRTALHNFQSANKKCYVHADTIGEAGTAASDYYLLSACQKIYLQPTGVLGLAGLSRTMPFGRKTLEKIGITPEFVHIGIYKSYPEMFEREDFSEPTRKMEENLLQNFKSTMITEISQDRGFDHDQFGDIFNNGPYSDFEAFQKHHLVDGLAYYTDFENSVFKEDFNTEDFLDIKEVSLFKYAAAVKARKQPKLKTKKIALIYADGDIIRGFDDSSSSNPFEEEESIKGNVIATKIKQAAEDDNIAGLIIRVNSPGGSPAPAETIRHEIEMMRTKYNKPVVASIVNVAASGGYWMIMSADKIIAQPLSITGSIGVFVGKFTMGDLADKIGLRFQTLSTGGNSNFFSLTEKFTDNQKKKLTYLIGNVYSKFVSTIKRDRQLKEMDETKFAEGRVWTGEQAYELGLVDALGGLKTAEQAMRDLLALEDEEEVEIMPYPKSISAFKQLLSLDSESVKTTMIPLLTKSFLYHNLDQLILNQGTPQSKTLLTQDF